MTESPQLPAQFLAYKQKAEEHKPQPAKIGNANCWGSFSLPQMMADPRTSVSSTSMPAPPTTANDGFGSSERSYGSSSNNNASSSGGILPPDTSDKITSMWSSFSSRLTGGADSSEIPQTHSAELDSKSGFPSNTQMTNADRLKNMAMSSVRKPEIPDAPEAPPAPVTIPTQSSFPSLASTRSDGSSSLESANNAQTGGRFWSIGNKMFGKKPPKQQTGIGSHEDPSIGEINKSTTAKSFFPSSMITTQKEDTKKDIDIEKLKRLRDQAAGLVPQSPMALPEEKKEEEQPASNKETSLESQIDDLEKEMGMTMDSSKSADVPPKLRMDGFDDVHEVEPSKNYAEIKVSAVTGVGSSSSSQFKPTAAATTKKVASPLAAAFTSSSPEKPKGLSTAV
eukprot:CAMPEP_0113618504 /NCGR_PEP_ID=MMETSP0017_2-20120614/9371_1 /TAXON_ID=2856 /ORGANISM="Cylindrotheca closterium" /LENGTH=394 /DNA_ID=CAMNT_0000528015 /DNA_START=166 /DNA_END=1350 /DNA_ORIENTATION=- /assembly_acc=CAM_ASM_000147